jgi:predicted Zn-dependent peptidase
VAGTEASLSKIGLEDATRWWTEYGRPERLTVAFSGGVDPELVRAALVERLGSAPPLGVDDDPPRFVPRPGCWLEKADFQMAQILGGFSFPSPSSARQAAVWQVASMLWGETMSSRLFQTIREQQGLCYSITSQVFDAEGTWGLQFFASCAPENLSALVAALGNEVERLSTHPPTSDEWEDARAALRGGIVLGAEKSENRTGRLWRQFESFGSVLGVDATMALLDLPVSEDEKAFVLDTLTSQVPSLMVWGKIPRRFVLPPTWTR